MSVSVLMPALSPTMTEGTLARWLVKEGDSVKSGDVIAEIETDKATMEVEALDDGVVVKLAVAEGTQNVAVNELIAVLAEDGESVDDALAAVAACARDLDPAARAVERVSRGGVHGSPPSPALFNNDTGHAPDTRLAAEARFRACAVAQRAASRAGQGGSRRRAAVARARAGTA